MIPAVGQEMTQTRSAWTQMAAEAQRPAASTSTLNSSSPLDRDGLPRPDGVTRIDAELLRGQWGLRAQRDDVWPGDAMSSETVPIDPFDPATEAPADGEGLVTQPVPAESPFCFSSLREHTALDGNVQTEHPTSA